MAQTRLKSGNLHMVGGDNGSAGNVLKSKGDGTMEWGAATTPPSFSSVDYPGDDTALDPAGGQNLVINGGGFLTGINVKVGGTNASSVTVNSVTQITIVTPAKSAGTYALEFTNTDGGNATANSAVSYNGVPAFTNAAGSLGAVTEGTTVNLSAAATEPDGGTITYAITSGALPSGLSFNTSTAAITGTAPDVDAATTSNFTVTATDNENQSTARAYSITVNPILPTDTFNILTYTGNGGTQTITGLSFQPDFVWLKKRNAGAEQMLNTSRVGTGEYFRPSYNSAGRLTASDIITSYNNNGFTLGSAAATNGNNDTFVAYCWKVNGGTSANNTDGSTTTNVEVNAAKGISMFTYGGAGAERTIGHGLGKKPDMFMMMDRYNGGGWRIWHKGLSSADKYMEFGTGGEQNNGSIWQGEEPTSSVIYLGNVVPPNGSGRQHICWAFTSIEGHSSFDSFVGTGSTTDRPIVQTGFEVGFLIIKRRTGGNWMMFDNKRNTSNPRTKNLKMNSSDAEDTAATEVVNFLSNGFEIGPTTDSNLNENGETYLYMAWATNPDVTAPTLADSFNAKAYNGTGSTQNVTGLGFSPSLTWLKERTGTDSHQLYDTVRGPNKVIYSNGTNAEYSGSEFPSFDADGFTVSANSSNNENGQTYIAWNWKGNDDEPTILQGSATAVYKFEDNYNDVTGNYNGSNTSGTSFVSSGKFNKGVQFTGTSASMNTGITAGTNESWSFWVKFGSSNTGYRILTCTNSSGDVGQNFEYSGSNSLYIVDILGGATNNSTSKTINLRDSNWHHIVFVKTVKTATLYVDKVRHLQVSNATGSALQGGNNWYFGRGQYGNANSDFQIDQARYYKGVLGQYAIDQLYAEATSNNDTLNFGGPPTGIASVNANAGFSITKATFTGMDTVPHGLGAAPEFVIQKAISTTDNWQVYHANVGTGKYLKLEDDGGASTRADSFPSVTAAGVRNQWTNGRQTYIMYSFRSIAGFSKIGTYTGSTTGVTVNVGFQPDFVLIKSSSNTEHWAILDSVRGSQKALFPNRNVAETNTALHTITFSSTGFSFPHQDTADAMLNENGYTYVYAAFKIN